MGNGKYVRESSMIRRCDLYIQYKPCIESQFDAGEKDTSSSGPAYMVSL